MTVWLGRQQNESILYSMCKNADKGLGVVRPTSPAHAPRADPLPRTDHFRPLAPNPSTSPSPRCAETPQNRAISGDLGPRRGISGDLAQSRAISELHATPLQSPPPAPPASPARRRPSTAHAPATTRCVCMCTHTHRTLPASWAALLSQDSTYSFCCHPKLSLPFLPAGVGRARGRGGCAAGVRDVCGPESDMPCPPSLRLFHNIEG